MQSADEALESRRRFQFMGSAVDIRITSEETSGLYAAIELSLPPSFPPPPRHYHKHLSERLIVLDGALEVELDGQFQRLETGESALAKPGVWHSFRNVKDGQTRMLIVASPGGHERFFQELMEWMAVEPVWPPEDRRKLAEFGLGHDVFYA